MRRRRPGALRLFAWAALGLVAAACAGDPRWPGAVPAAPELAAGTVAADVAWLADPAREGRGLGTRGLAEAGRYLAGGFRAAGFQPASEGDYLQGFRVPVAIEVSEARLSWRGRELRRGEDFDVLLASRSGPLAEPLVFAGHGISDEASGHDDYRHLDVEGRTVLVLDGRPEDESGDLGGARGAAYARVAYKLLNARQHGAAAVVLAPSVLDVPGLPGLGPAGGANPTIQDAGVVAVSVNGALARELLEAVGRPTQGAQAPHAGATSPRATGLSGRVRVDRTSGQVDNVVAWLPGSDPELAHEAVVVGAHYDHLGLGEFGSLSPDRVGEVHPGADDNASGSAALLALARAFGRAPPPRRTLVLAAFTAEEAGLLGSARYVEEPPIPLDGTVAMINLDMVGRLRDDTVTVFGAETAAGFRDLVRRAASELGLRVAFETGAEGPSDQTSFVVAGVPVLFFFTGTHPAYHTPDDVPAAVDAQGVARVAELSYRVTRAILDADERPAFAGTRGSRTGADRAASPGYGPYLGTVPAFGGEPVEGVRLSAVRANSPAEEAGIRGGDVIVSFGGSAVRNLEEFAALLFASRPGQEVDIVVLRGGARVETRARLGQRR